MNRQRHKRAFTLVEVLIASVLVGLAIAALVASNGAFSMANAAGADLSTAEFLIEQVREMTAMLPAADPDDAGTFGPEEPNLVTYDDVDDFSGAIYSPPINANRVVLNDFPTHAQRITVAYVRADDFETVLTSSPSDFVRVTVTITQNGRETSESSWIRANY